MTKKRIAVYSCITGAYEPLLNGQNFDGADFYLFTDNPQPTIYPWIQKEAVTLFSDPRRNSRYHKLLSHEFFPDYDYTIWIDGSVVLKTSAEQLVNELEQNSFDILTSYHPARKTVEEEAQECLRLKLDVPTTIMSHIKRMFDKGFPDKEGLAETKVVVRTNNPIVHEFNKIWFYQNTTGSLRDQLSFPYAIWDSKIDVKYMPPITEQPDRFEFIKAGDHITRRTYEAVS